MTDASSRRGPRVLSPRAVTANSRGVALRAAGRKALGRVEETALAALRRPSGSSVVVARALRAALKNMHSYGEYMEAELELEISRDGAFGNVLVDHLQQFRERQEASLEQLIDEFERAPRKVQIMRRVLSTALVLIADLDAHSADLTLIRVPRASAASMDAGEDEA